MRYLLLFSLILLLIYCGGGGGDYEPPTEPDEGKPAITASPCSTVLFYWVTANGKRYRYATPFRHPVEHLEQGVHLFQVQAVYLNEECGSPVNFELLVTKYEDGSVMYEIIPKTWVENFNPNKLLLEVVP